MEIKNNNGGGVKPYINIAKLVLIVVIILALGTFAINQYFGFRYKIVFLGTPCELCTKLNPEWMACYNQFKVGTHIYSKNYTFQNNSYNFNDSKSILENLKTSE